jgi:hypothetical protein
MSPRTRIKSPKDLYWCVFTCESCGRRVRASQALRSWSSRPVPSLQDAEFMLTRSGGPRRLTNDRGPLFEIVASIPNFDARFAMKERLAEFLSLEAERLAEAARVAREGAFKARYL